MFDKKQPLPDACYRVSTRALIYDGRSRILVLEKDDGNYMLPGGGWEFKESLGACIIRELEEELGVDPLYIGEVAFVYRGRSHKDKPWHLRLAVPVFLKDEQKDFKFEPGIKNAYYINRATFLNTTFARDEEEIKKHVDEIWLPVEKMHIKR